jgi:hypothetical protein
VEQVFEIWCTSCKIPSNILIYTGITRDLYFPKFRVHLAKSQDPASRAELRWGTQWWPEGHRRAGEALKNAWLVSIRWFFTQVAWVSDHVAGPNWRDEPMQSWQPSRRNSKKSYIRPMPQHNSPTPTGQRGVDTTYADLSRVRADLLP